MSRTVYIFALIICISALAGCAGTSTQTAVEEVEEEDDAIRIGFTMDSYIIERWERDRDVFVSAAQELGAEVNIQNANGDTQEQIDQIDYFIDQGMDVIVIVQVASDENLSGLTEAVNRAHQAGIPVVSYDRLIQDADVDLYISFDNEAVGRLMGEHMAEHLEEGSEIIQICGPLADSNVSMVMQGFEAALADSGIEILQTDYAEEWLVETGYDVTSEYLDQYGSVAGIMCGNDGIAGAAVRALSEHRLSGTVCIVGQDADLEACQRIVEGTQCMTVYKEVENLARRAAELSVALALGEDTGITETMSDGTYEVLCELLEPVAVTAENMDEVITGKYHEESDIYLNVR